MMIMEYFSDGNISDCSPLEGEEYITSFGQVLDGLSYLHGNGIAHRDLKPENLLVARAPLFRVAIADFGLSKAVPDKALLSTFCGTLEYAAPEVFPHSLRGHDQLADIWALGVIVLQWLYDAPAPPSPPKALKQEIQPWFWHEWTRERSKQLNRALSNMEDGDILYPILRHMIEPKKIFRKTAKACLDQGIKDRIFKRRQQDNLIECAVEKETITKEDCNPTISGVRSTSPIGSDDEEAQTIVVEPNE